MGAVQIGRETMQQVAQMPSVQAALQAKARLVFGIAQTEAYSNLFMELATDAKAASEFVNGIVPPKTEKAAQADQSAEAPAVPEN